MRYRITLSEVGPRRWTWELAALLPDERVEQPPMRHGMAKTRDEAEQEARDWLDWEHNDRQSGAKIERIDVEL